MGALLLCGATLARASATFVADAPALGWLMCGHRPTGADNARIGSLFLRILTF